MVYIYFPNEINEDHLEKVKIEMNVIGNPIIRVVDGGDHYIALEGSHRLTAANNLGIVPKLKIVGLEDILKDICQECDYEEMTALELSEVFLRSQQFLKFEEVEIVD